MRDGEGAAVFAAAFLATGFFASAFGAAFLSAAVLSAFLSDFGFLSAITWRLPYQEPARPLRVPQRARLQARLVCQATTPSRRPCERRYGRGTRASARTRRACGPPCFPSRRRE